MQCSNTRASTSVHCFCLLHTPLQHWALDNCSAVNMGRSELTHPNCIASCSQAFGGDDGCGRTGGDHKRLSRARPRSSTSLGMAGGGGLQPGSPVVGLVGHHVSTAVWRATHEQVRWDQRRRLQWSGETAVRCGAVWCGAVRRGQRDGAGSGTARGRACEYVTHLTSAMLAQPARRMAKMSSRLSRRRTRRTPSSPWMTHAEQGQACMRPRKGTHLVRETPQGWTPQEDGTSAKGQCL